MIQFLITGDAGWIWVTQDPLNESLVSEDNVLRRNPNITGKFAIGLSLDMAFNFCAQSCSVQLKSAKHFQLLRTQVHVFSYSDTALPW
jgi:hypothetical protein